MHDVIGEREQVQVVIAEHGDSGVAQVLDEAQGLQGLRPTVDEVADEPELVEVGIELERIQQLAKRIVAPLQVADRIRRQRSLPV